jgi:hypothetical protein
LLPVTGATGHAENLQAPVWSRLVTRHLRRLGLALSSKGCVGGGGARRRAMV